MAANAPSPADRHAPNELRRHPPAEGARVLDLGCGFGDTTFELAQLVGPRGTATGVDAAARFVEESRRGASASGVLRNVRRALAPGGFVSAQLLGAGFSRVTFERFDYDICIGRDLEDAVAFAVAIGPAGEMLRFAAARGENKTREVEAALKVALSPFVRSESVYAPSSTWIVSARAT